MVMDAYLHDKTQPASNAEEQNLTDRVYARLDVGGGSCGYPFWSTRGREARCPSLRRRSLTVS